MCDELKHSLKARIAELERETSATLDNLIKTEDENKMLEDSLYRLGHKWLQLPRMSSAPEDMKAFLDSCRDAEEFAVLDALRERIADLEREHSSAVDKLAKSKERTKELNYLLDDHRKLRRVRSSALGVFQIHALADVGSSGGVHILAATSAVVAVVKEGLQKIFFIPTRQTSLQSDLGGVLVYYGDLDFSCCFSPDGLRFILGHSVVYDFAATVIIADDVEFKSATVRYYSSEVGIRFDYNGRLFFCENDDLFHICGNRLTERLDIDDTEGIVRRGPALPLTHCRYDNVYWKIHYTQGQRVAFGLYVYNKDNIPFWLVDMSRNQRRHQKLPHIPCRMRLSGFVKSASRRENSSVQCIVVDDNGHGLIWDDICGDSFTESSFRFPCGQSIKVEQEVNDKAYFIVNGKLYGGRIKPDNHSLEALSRAFCLSLATEDFKKESALELLSYNNFIHVLEGRPLQKEPQPRRLRMDY